MLPVAAEVPGAGRQLASATTPGGRSRAIGDNQSPIKASSSLASVMQCDDAPYDAKVIGDYTDLTPPFGFED